MRRLRIAILVPALFGLVACAPPFVDKGEPLPVGTVLVESGTAPGVHAFITIPTGRIDFTVGGPIQKLPIEHETYGHAPDGGSIVSVSWVWDPASGFESMADERTSAVQPHVSLVADGREYSLDQAMLTSFGEDLALAQRSKLDPFGTAWVGVEGEPRELAIRVEFGGLEQEVEAGNVLPIYDTAARSLYISPDDLGLRASACAPPWSGGRALPETSGVCVVETARVPYHPAVGWVASREDSWLLVRSRLGVDRVRAAPDDCGPGEVGEVTFRLDGAKPVAVERADPDDILGRELAIFVADDVVSPNELVMRAQLTYPDGDCAPVTLTWRDPLY